MKRGSTVWRRGKGGTRLRPNFFPRFIPLGAFEGVMAPRLVQPPALSFMPEPEKGPLVWTPVHAVRFWGAPRHSTHLFTWLKNSKCLLLYCTLKNGLTVRNKSSFYNKFFSILCKRYLVTLLSYCEYVPSSAITNTPFYQLLYLNGPKKEM
jgi:hypothetical protein